MTYEEARAVATAASERYKAALDTPAPNPRDYPLPGGRYDSNALHAALDERSRLLTRLQKEWESAAICRNALWRELHP